MECARGSPVLVPSNPAVCQVISPACGCRAYMRAGQAMTLLSQDTLAATSEVDVYRLLERYFDDVTSGNVALEYETGERASPGDLWGCCRLAYLPDEVVAEAAMRDDVPVELLCRATLVATLVRVRKSKKESEGDGEAALPPMLEEYPPPRTFR